MYNLSIFGAENYSFIFYSHKLFTCWIPTNCMTCTLREKYTTHFTDYRYSMIKVMGYIIYLNVI